MFFWDNFSDEEILSNAELKVWTSESDVGMRYSTTAGGMETKKVPKVSAAELLQQAIEDVMSACKQDGIQLRLVGHSMGSQMVIRASYLLAQRVEEGLAPRSYLPSRVA